MPKLIEMQQTSIHRALIYGAPKSGKSLLAGTLAEKYNLIWFDLENGHEVLFKLPIEWQERVTVVPIPDTSDFPVASGTCLNVMRKNVPQDICEQHGKISCQLCKRDSKPFYTFDKSQLGPQDVVVFDSATQLTASCINYITRDQPDDYKLNYDDWGNLGKLMDIFYSNIQNAPFNVVVISHETNASLEEKGKEQLVPVSGTRNYSRNVSKFFDDVIYCQRKNKKHVFASSTTYNSNILTGSRRNIAMENDEARTVKLTDVTTSSLVPIFEAPIVRETPSSNAQAKTILTGLQKKATQ